MTFTPTVSSLVPFSAAIMAGVVAVAVRVRRWMPGGLTFTIMMLAICEWMLCKGLSTAALDVPNRWLFLKLSMAGEVAAPALLLQFALWYRDREWWRRWWIIVVIWVIPFALLVLSLTNDAHHLSWIAMDQGFLTPGVAQWIWLSNANVYTLVSAVLIAQPQWQASSPLYNKQTALLLAGFACPVLGSIVSFLPWVRLSGVDPIGVGFACMGLLMLIGILRYGLMDIVPIARDALVEEMSDGLIVLDALDRIVDLNPVALRLLGLASAPLGRHARAFLGSWAENVARMRETGAAHAEAPYLHDPDRWCDLQVTALRGRDGIVYGWLLVVRDLTDRKQVEKQREQLIKKLEDALADVKTLSGLLPICASCKKIRDDHGYWQQLEQYVTSHSDAQFSHGLCPDCARRLYPDLLKEE